MAFCPSCGTQNPDAANVCSSCGAAMGGGGGGGGGQKFKGTILMGGPSGADVEAMVAKAKAAAQAPRAPAGAPPMPQGGLAFQATMLSPTAGGEAFPNPPAADAQPAAPDVPSLDSPLRPSGFESATLREAPDAVKLDFSGDDLDAVVPKSGKGPMLIVLLILGLLLVGGIATGVVFYLRSRAAVPEYPIPGYPGYPGVPGVPGALPGQVPGAGAWPGQVPGAFPQVPPGVPGVPPAPVPAPPPTP